MNDRKKTSIAFSVSLAKLVKQRGIDLDLDFSSAVEEACRQWVSAPKPVAQELPKAQSTGTKYRPENIPWHDRLEMTLNDPDEKLGIQKNLEWAERTVTSKLNQARPAGKRASGE